MPESQWSPTARVHRALAPARDALAARDAEIVRSQITIAEIPAPTGGEQRRGAWMAQQLRALGLTEVRTDGAGNVIGRRAGARSSEPSVVVCAHLDTVFPADTPLVVSHDGRLLRGPGIGDNARGLAALLALARAVDGTAVRTRRPIDFVATTGEEGAGDLRGVKHLFADGSRASAMIALDGAGDERIICRALGSRRYRISYRGPGGHSWAAYGVPNAVHAAGIAAAKLAMLPLPREPRTTLSVGRIGGGIAVNAIPDEGWLELDLRSTSMQILERLDREVQAIARAAAQEESGRRAPNAPALSVEVGLIGDRPCGETAAEHPLVLAAAEATRFSGREPELATASTDANVPISRGIPAIAIGAGGSGGEAHTLGEWFDNTHGAVGIARALTIVVSAAGLIL